jgi:hypothetical protein
LSKGTAADQNVSTKRRAVRVSCAMCRRKETASQE